MREIQLYDLKHFLEVVQRVAYVLDSIEADVNVDAFPHTVTMRVDSPNGYQLGTVVWMGEEGCEVFFDKYGEEME